MNQHQEMLSAELYFLDFKSIVSFAFKTFKAVTGVFVKENVTDLEMCSETMQCYFMSLAVTFSKLIQRFI